jgi:hypothetical protein
MNKRYPNSQGGNRTSIGRHWPHVRWTGDFSPPEISRCRTDAFERPDSRQSGPPAADPASSDGGFVQEPVRQSQELLALLTRSDDEGTAGWLGGGHGLAESVPVEQGQQIDGGFSAPRRNDCLYAGVGPHRRQLGRAAAWRGADVSGTVHAPAADHFVASRFDRADLPP